LPVVDAAARRRYDPPARHEGLTRSVGRIASAERARPTCSNHVGRVCACLVSTSTRSRRNSSFAAIAKQAKQLVRCHREGNHSIGGRIRRLARYRTLTDREALALAFPLRETQEIIALDAGYASWAAMKVAVADGPSEIKPAAPALRLTRAVQDRDGFIVAFIEVENVKALYAEYVASGAIFDQKLKKAGLGRPRLRRARCGRQRAMFRGAGRVRGRAGIGIDAGPSRRMEDRRAAD
jgi:hypothetical protein